MKQFKLICAIIAPLFFSSCIVIDRTPGPNGHDGNAYFGVDYEHRPPYSYWDNNSAIPFNPILGEYYLTQPGLYEFEYFINEFDYYYGTYEVWINRGGVGGPYGEPGYNGIDTYLMFIADPYGYHQYTSGYKMELNEPLIVEKKYGEFNYKISLKKGNTKTRPAQQPKFLSN